MPMLFGTERTTHPLEEDMASYISDNGEDQSTFLSRSVALNISYDSRVSLAREASFLEVRGHNPKESLEACIRHYHAIRVRRKREFTRKGNDSNKEASSSPGDKLLTLFNLSKIYTSLQAVAELSVKGSWTSEDKAVFDTAPFFPAFDPKEFPDWLDKRLADSSYERTLAAILKGLAITGEQKPYRPRWVTMKESVAPYLSYLEKLWTILGQQPPKKGDWFIILGYELRDVPKGVLYRPTQLDAGWFGFHFPSPVCSSWGHPMNVGSANINDDLVEEYIHNEIAPSLEQWKDAGKIRPYKIASGYPFDAKAHRSDRANHLARLQKRYARSCGILSSMPI